MVPDEEIRKRKLKQSTYSLPKHRHHHIVAFHQVNFFSKPCIVSIWVSRQLRPKNCVQKFNLQVTPNTFLGEVFIAVPGNMKRCLCRSMPKKMGTNKRPKVICESVSHLSLFFNRCKSFAEKLWNNEGHMLTHLTIGVKLFLTLEKSM